MLLFYGDDIHEDEYSKATIAGYTPPEIRSLIEVSATAIAATKTTATLTVGVGHFGVGAKFGRKVVASLRHLTLYDSAQQLAAAV